MTVLPFINSFECMITRSMDIEKIGSRARNTLVKLHPKLNPYTESISIKGTRSALNVKQPASVKHPMN